METIRLLRVFLASPGDVKTQRDAAEKIILETNRTIGEANGVRVEVTRWETDAKPSWGRDGQAIINELIEKRAHAAFVVLFWNRFGSPTPRAASGTLEEFQLALKKRLRAKRGGARPPEIMLYFNSAPTNLTTKRELEQRQAVLDFKDSIKDGLYGSYKGKADFERKFREDYSKWLLAEIEALNKPRRARKTAAPTAPAEKVAPTDKPASKPRAARPTTPRLKLEPILLNDKLFYVEPQKVVESGDRWTLAVRPQQGDDRRIRDLTNPAWNREFAFAYKLQAGRARLVGQAKRTSDEGGDLWTMEVRFTPAQSGVHAVNFNGTSADEIADQRARWLLLGREPTLPAPRNAWETPDRFLLSHIKGSGASGEPILSALWKKCAGDTARFKAMAPLVVLGRLIEAGVCEHVETLKLGAVRAGKVTVEFRGSRDLMRRGQEQKIEVKGTCALGDVVKSGSE